jgi:hypothetical protein
VCAERSAAGGAVTSAAVGADRLSTDSAEEDETRSPDPFDSASGVADCCAEAVDDSSGIPDAEADEVDPKALDAPRSSEPTSARDAESAPPDAPVPGSEIFRESGSSLDRA